MTDRRLAQLLSLAIAACAGTERVVLLPGADGTSSGRIVVTYGNKSIELAEPYATASVSLGGIATASASAEEVNRSYGALLKTLPRQTRGFVLYFERGSTHLTRESEQSLAAIRATLHEFPAAEYRVVGHTDRVGKAEKNDLLSLQRAQAVRKLLVEDMFPPIPADSVTVAGRGEREPLVPTEDEVAEPRNRRVEVRVR